MLRAREAQLHWISDPIFDTRSPYDLEPHVFSIFNTLAERQEESWQQKSRQECSNSEWCSKMCLQSKKKCHLWGCLRAGKPVSALNICTSQTSVTLGASWWIDYANKDENTCTSASILFSQPFKRVTIPVYITAQIPKEFWTRSSHATLQEKYIRAWD